jgi:hypothetical protein
MKHLATTILETAVRMHYADNPDPTKATAWIEFQVPLANLTIPVGDGRDLEPLGDPGRLLLAALRGAALRYAQDVLGEETQRLSGL